MLLPVILVGGTGSRLWPLSRELYPKQFLSIKGSYSLLQTTVKRLSGLTHEAPLFLCNEEYRFIVKEQLQAIQQDYSGIILEPISKNTAPAIALAALKSMQLGEDPLLLVLPSDHLISDEKAFHEAVHKAIPHAQAGNIIVFGISPTHAETGYGYIQKGQLHEGAYEVKAFVEKPDESHALSYLSSGDYYWNSGIFLFRASVYLKALQQCSPEIYRQCFLSLQQAKKNLDFITIDKVAFEECPADSIDYAVMEHVSNALLIPLNAGWSDIGSWSALWDNCDKNEQGNVHQGDVIGIESNNCFIRSEDKLVVTIGLDNIVAVNTKDALLIASKDRVQDVKKAVAVLNETSRAEAKTHKEVFRPWGKYDSLAQGTRYQVKRITVKPGEKLSTQMHHHRAEHWVVVSGTAKVTEGDKVYYLTENQSTYIPIGEVHRLRNPGKLDLEMIEVQSGSYLGEDDIVRFEDVYGRG